MTSEASRDRLQLLTGLNDPIRRTPPRGAGSIRRTTSIDIVRAADGLTLDGSARDLHTRSGGGAAVRASAAVHAEIGADRTLVSLTASEGLVAEPLVGRAIGRGFRAAVRRCLPAVLDCTPFMTLLDEIPVAVLISGYAALYRGEPRVRASEASALPADICAGWQSSGTMLTALRTTGAIPVPLGPAANSLVGDDALAWHDAEPLPAGAMRRQRLLDVGPGRVRAVYAMFRDTHADESTGSSTILHEYSLTAGCDTTTGKLLDVVATPHVLPWDECPAAAASAGRLDGRSPREVRALVSAELRGTSTCTHLNDLLRSLADLPSLLDG